MLALSCNFSTKGYAKYLEKVQIYPKKSFYGNEKELAL